MNSATLSRAFAVGDLVILNSFDAPTAMMVCVVVKDDGKFYHCKYLNADSRFDAYSNPAMMTSLDYATKLADFGVKLRAHNGRYWCEVIGKSKATYEDGRPRSWQEYDRPNTYKLRPELALWPF